jgi:hypothetical protein
VVSPAPPRATVASVSALALTSSTLFALERARLRISRVGFAFALSAPARVTVTLARWTRSRHRGRWRLAARPYAFTAAAGRRSAHLGGRRALVAGQYRLTLTPAQGVSEWIVFRIG